MAPEIILAGQLLGFIAMAAAFGVWLLQSD
jgi:hypothetical protein